MTSPALETVEPPFVTFRFEVVMDLAEPPPGLDNPVCNAAFAECDGLEMSIEPKTFHEGGNSLEQHHLVSKVSYGQLTLRRGMTANLQLWQWMAAAAVPGKDLTAEGRITLWGADGTPQLTWVLRECLPIRMRGPSLNAKDGQVAIEEMQLVYRSLELRPAGAGGSGLSFGAGAGVSAGFSASASAGFSASAGVSASAGFSAGASAGISVSGGAGLSGGASFG